MDEGAPCLRLERPAAPARSLLILARALALWRSSGALSSFLLFHQHQLATVTPVLPWRRSRTGLLCFVEQAKSNRLAGYAADAAARRQHESGPRMLPPRVFENQRNVVTVDNRSESVFIPRSSDATQLATVTLLVLPAGRIARMCYRGPYQAATMDSRRTAGGVQRGPARTAARSPPPRGPPRRRPKPAFARAALRRPRASSARPPALYITTKTTIVRSRVPASDVSHRQVGAYHEDAGAENGD